MFSQNDDDEERIELIKDEGTPYFGNPNNNLQNRSPNKEAGNIDEAYLELTD
jgi:hypothetical protein